MYRWTRDLHLYGGLFISPFVIAFAVSVFFLNHAKIDPAARTSVSIETVIVPAGLAEARGRQAVDLARAVADQVHVRGEIGFVRYVRAEQRLIIPVSAPGRETVIDVDVAKRTARVTRRRTGVLESTGYLHKTPGPHNADLRGNWIWTRVWRWCADGTVYLLMFISASGVYLWLAIMGERRIGLALLGAGAASFAGFMYVLAF